MAEAPPQSSITTAIVSGQSARLAPGARAISRAGPSASDRSDSALSLDGRRCCVTADSAAHPSPHTTAAAHSSSSDRLQQLAESQIGPHRTHVHPPRSPDTDCGGRRPAAVSSELRWPATRGPGGGRRRREAPRVRRDDSPVSPECLSDMRCAVVVKICFEQGLSHLVQSCFSYRSCMSKDSARSTGHAGYFFPKKKILRNLQEIND